MIPTQRHRIRPVRVLIETASARQGQQQQYAGPVPAYGHILRHRIATDGSMRKDDLTMVFAASSTGASAQQHAVIRGGNGLAVALPLDSRITWNGRYLTVTQVETRVNNVTGRRVDVTVMLRDAGQAAETTALLNDSAPAREDGHGVHHDVRDARPADARLGETKQ